MQQSDSKNNLRLERATPSVLKKEKNLALYPSTPPNPRIPGASSNPVVPGTDAGTQYAL